MIIRERYLKNIRPFYDQDLIKVLIGIRRSGKSVLLTQIMDEIKNKGVNEENIIMIFNSAFGKIEDLPFDLRGKRIMQYSCPKDAELDRKKGYKEALIKQLQRAIQLSCRYELR